jgi:adenine-specific DNA-methyltransferase
MRAAGRSSSDVLASVRARLSGIEVEPGLARLSEALVADIFASEIAIEGAGSLNIIQRASALKVNEPTRLYDAVICNPPYGRVFKASEDLLKRWAAVISAGHVNTYAIFTAMSLNRVVPGGLVALVLPTSFIAGPYFRALRSFILDKAHIESLDLVDKRSGAFIDVVQDTCVLFLRRKAAGLLPPPVPTSSLIASDGSAVGRGRLEVPASGSGVWVLPDISRVNLCTSEAAPFFHEGLSNLTEYGYTVKAGYFVWNRSKDRLHERVAPIEGEIPLIWAHNVRPGEEIKLGPRKGNAKDNASRSFVRVSPESSAVVRTAAIVIQRTTNRLQKRRIVAGKVPISLIETYGGFVTENHTLVVAPLLGKPQRVSLEVLLDLLCSIALDGKFRRVSGTVSVSAQVLRELPLPNPEVLVLETLKSGDFETAVVNAYAGSMGLRS